jgi:hypothetical protein
MGLFAAVFGVYIRFPGVDTKRVVSQILRFYRQRGTYKITRAMLTPLHNGFRLYRSSYVPVMAIRRRDQHVYTT